MGDSITTKIPVHGKNKNKKNTKKHGFAWICFHTFETPQRTEKVKSSVIFIEEK